MVDITTPEDRTIRLAILDGLFLIGFDVGNGLAGPINTYLGLEYNFVVGMTAALIGTVYTLFVVKESHRKVHSETGMVTATYMYILIRYLHYIIF